MIRVVVDTNCLLASIPPNSSGYALYLAFEAEQIEWVVSNEIITEYEEKLAQKYSPATANLILTILTLAPNTLFQEAYYKWQLIERDHDDDKFVDVAIASNANYLVTNDHHFDVLKTDGNLLLRVVTLQEFLNILDEIN
ncbi:putative toxin-antitoxin system toxin component, PIN family [Spirosoma montaniterrae]|uniref:PIN domain-containing protein n=1 Tax=Spirosoma montaniterrae TaxID=1178516 RepID=A0A1P9X061_9BACT|nr:putative toxin-antitoxin system toxin component, PIN family [Spirosoma montaniterrae]AQG81012.1 hypothetical protein AWR27_17800 [Spirosoma montaniterrae]